ncbi:MAG: septum formation initiator family protein [Mediterranea sp.]|jgi:cell division protein FtsB|nr:septum formation initiator family protein [Mediterranea sp.]
MHRLAKLWAFIRRHKYLITIGLFVLIVGFLDENSLLNRMTYRRQIDQLNREIDYYRKDYEENTRRLNELAVDSGAIERIAREKYLMKKPNEDIYIFEEDLPK